MSKITKRCDYCRTIEASAWRKHPHEAGKYLCNSCGIFYSRHGKFKGSNQPTSLSGGTQGTSGNSPPGTMDYKIPSQQSQPQQHLQQPLDQPLEQPMQPMQPINPVYPPSYNQYEQQFGGNEYSSYGEYNNQMSDFGTGDTAKPNEQEQYSSFSNPEDGSSGDMMRFHRARSGSCNEIPSAMGANPPPPAMQNFIQGGPIPYGDGAFPPNPAYPGYYDSANPSQPQSLGPYRGPFDKRGANLPIDPTFMHNPNYNTGYVQNYEQNYDTTYNHSYGQNFEQPYNPNFPQGFESNPVPPSTATHVQNPPNTSGGLMPTNYNQDYDVNQSQGYPAYPMQSEVFPQEGYTMHPPNKVFKSHSSSEMFGVQPPSSQGNEIYPTQGGEMYPYVPNMPMGSWSSHPGQGYPGRYPQYTNQYGEVMQNFTPDPSNYNYMNNPDYQNMYISPYDRPGYSYPNQFDQSFNAGHYHEEYPPNYGYNVENYTTSQVKEVDLGTGIEASAMNLSSVPETSEEYYGDSHKGLSDEEDVKSTSDSEARPDEDMDHESPRKTQRGQKKKGRRGRTAKSKTKESKKESKAKDQKKETRGRKRKDSRPSALETEEMETVKKESTESPVNEVAEIPMISQEVSTAFSEASTEENLAFNEKNFGIPVSSTFRNGNLGQKGRRGRKKKNVDWKAAMMSNTTDVRDPLDFREHNSLDFIHNHPLYEEELKDGKVAKDYDMGPAWTTYEDDVLISSYQKYGRNCKHILSTNNCFHPRRKAFHLENRLRYFYQRDYREYYDVWLESYHSVTDLNTEGILQCLGIGDDQEQIIIKYKDLLKRKNKESNPWTDSEIQIILLGVRHYGDWFRPGRQSKRAQAWQKISEMLPGRNATEVRTYFVNNLYEDPTALKHISAEQFMEQEGIFVDDVDSDYFEDCEDFEDET